jgi:hypothetical protein
VLLFVHRLVLSSTHESDEINHASVRVGGDEDCS